MNDIGDLPSPPTHPPTQKSGGTCIFPTDGETPDKPTHPPSELPPPYSINQPLSNGLVRVCGCALCGMVWWAAGGTGAASGSGRGCTSTRTGTGAMKVPEEAPAGSASPAAGIATRCQPSPTSRCGASANSADRKMCVEPSQHRKVRPQRRTGTHHRTQGQHHVSWAMGVTVSLTNSPNPSCPWKAGGRGVGWRTWRHKMCHFGNKVEVLALRALH